MRLYFILLLLSTFKLYAQVPFDARSYLNNKQVSKVAKEYYNGKFKASDEEKTFEIVDSLRTKNHLTRPFYIYLVSTMMANADAALSEELGNKCKEFVEQQPDDAIGFLYSDNKEVDKRFKDNWAKAIAGEFMIQCEGEENNCINKSLQRTLKRSNSEIKIKAITFYNQIRSYCH